jgi:hypothetical protein
VWAILLVIWAPYCFTAISSLFQLTFKKNPPLPLIPLFVVSGVYCVMEGMFK